MTAQEVQREKDAGGGEGPPEQGDGRSPPANLLTPLFRRHVEHPLLLGQVLNLCVQTVELADRFAAFLLQPPDLPT